MKKSFLPTFLIAISCSFCKAQTPTLLGLTGNSIFGYDLVKDSGITLYEFVPPNDGSAPRGSLTKASNGIIYGMTSMGPGNDQGVLFSYRLSTHQESILHSFSGLDGSNPLSSLIQASNGLLYGLTARGGGFGEGNLFSYNISNNSFVNIHGFGADSDGYNTWGAVIQANNGLLYGVTRDGGTGSVGQGGGGTIFSFDPLNNTYSDIYNFNFDSGGSMPNGYLLQASNSLIYGTTYGGGVNNYGTIFTYNVATGALTDVHDFGYSSGFNPSGALIQASNGLLYGMTILGGTDSVGVIFSYNISTSEYSVLYNFPRLANGFTNYSAQYNSSLMQASNGLLYGMTEFGGQYGSGWVFSYDIATTQVNDVYDAGGDPWGGLIEVMDTPEVTSVLQLPAINDNFQISPNPSTGQFTIQLPNTQNSCPAEVYNMLGQKVAQLTLSANNNTLNLTNQPTGMYFVYLQTETGRVGAKVVVER